jgi:outer membrane protein TolC
MSKRVRARRPGCRVAPVSAVIAGALSWTAAHAAPVSLEDVIAAAQHDGPLLQHENEKVNRALGQLQQAQGAFEWTVSAQTGWEILYVPKAKDGVLTDDLETTGALHTTVGASRLFRNGISIQPGVSVYSNTGVSAAQSFGLTQPRPALNLDIPLIRGFGSASPAAVAEEVAKSTLQGARLERNFVAQQNVTNAVQVFWHCLAARRQVEILESDARSSNAYVQGLRQQAQGGQIEPTVLDRIIAKQAILQVSLSTAYGADQICQRDLVTIVGLSPDGSLPVPSGDLPIIDTATNGQMNEGALADAALERRQDLKGLGEAETAAAIAVEGAQDTTRPRVDLYFDPTRVMVRVSKPLGGDDAAQGQLAQAQANQSDARINREQLQAAIRVDVATASRNLETAQMNWNALHQSEDLLTGVVADAQKRLQAGLIRPEEYRDMQDELAQVQRQVIDARLQYASSLAALRLATGTAGGEGASPSELAALFRSPPQP